MHSNSGWEGALAPGRQRNSDVDDLAFLNSLPLFTGIPAPDLAAIHRMCHTERHAAGAVILRQGDASADLYVDPGKIDDASDPQRIIRV